MWSTCLRPRLFSTVRRHLSAHGIRRNKINLPPLREGESNGGTGKQRGMGETHGESVQEGRKEGRKRERKEGRVRERKREKEKWKKRDRIEDTYALPPHPLVFPSCRNLRDSHRPSLLHPSRYENAPRFPPKKTRDIRRGARTILLVRTRTDAVTRTKRSAKEYNSVGHKPRGISTRLAGRTFLTFKRREIFRHR